jgi:hypothetical protein
MKIIITESQKEELENEYAEGIRKRGFLETADLHSLKKLMLAKLSGLPIKGDTFHNENEITVGNLLRDLVNRNREYETCTLHYEGMSGIVEWDCKFMDDENYYRLTIAATPYWDGHNTTPIDMFNVEVTPINSPEDKREFDTTIDYFNEFECPESFENASKLVDWFKDEYIPKTYDIIVESYKEFKEREL